MKFTRETENLIALFRGLPLDKSRSKIRETVPMEKLMGDILQKYRLGGPTPEEVIIENWTSIVGEANAQYSHLMRIERERSVFIGVSNPIVRQELFFHRKQTLEKIRKLPHCSKLRELILRAG
ncbi:MAG: DciA family protein [Opitutales bacterium]